MPLAVRAWFVVAFLLLALTGLLLGRIVEFIDEIPKSASGKILRRLLRDSGYDARASERLEAVRRGKVAAIDAKDYRSATTARRLERELLEDARARLTIDLDVARSQAQRLIEVARENLGADGLRA